MTSLSSYSSIFSLQHRALKELLDSPVVVQEKIDGSQFSFGIDKEGNLRLRSKGQPIDPNSPPKMFAGGVAHIISIKDKLAPNCVYRGEFLGKPKHNVLSYDRVPKGFIVLFDIDKGEQNYVCPEVVRQEAETLGLDAVPTYYEGKVNSSNIDSLMNDFITRTSVLGGPIEGVVIKNYDRFGTDKKILIGKYVKDDFKEAHKKEWNTKPTRPDVIVNITKSLTTEARWRKAVQHLRDEGTLLNAPQDIGPLMAEVVKDVEKEEVDWIKDKLYQHFRRDVLKGTTLGLPEWYKNELNPLAHKGFEITLDGAVPQADGTP